VNTETILTLAFLMVCVVVDRATPVERRWIGLLAFGALFLAACSPVSLLLLVILTPLNFYSGLAIGSRDRDARSSLALGLLIGINLLPLLFYKYALPTGFAGASSLVIPLGLSFYTFSNLSYLIDIHRGLMPAEQHLGHFGSFVFFFPKLGAGPIERPSAFLRQLKESRPHDPRQFRQGVLLVLVGLQKKLLLASSLAIVVLPVFREPNHHSALTLLTAAILARYYIYSDFSSYTDLARGAAKLMGIELSENFRSPFAARSVTDFWQRWHISLSTWLRDYVYFSLVTSRLARMGNSILIVLSFLCLGLWHGATIPFVCYGLFHGLSVAFWIRSAGFRGWLTAKLRLERFPRFVAVWQVGSTFIFFACLPTVLFMSSTIQAALFSYETIGSALLGLEPLGRLDFYENPGHVYGKCLLFIATLELSGYVNRKFALFERISSCSFGPRWIVYTLMGLTLLIFGTGNTNLQFVYFQF
jgi:alginate O-acetyltransferase complex protein AlgI